jgi:type I restriction enzyme, R subunit
MVKNVVLIRIIGTMTEFKQIIGRGTRLREDYGKLYFNILDYTGTATRHFADKEFDGDPEFVSEEEIDGEGNTTTTTVVDPGPEPTDGEGGDDDNDEEVMVDPGPSVIIEPPVVREDPAKYYVTKGKVSISTHLTQDLDAEGKQLRATEFRDYTGEIVRTLFVDMAMFRHGWSDPDRRAEILAELEAKGIRTAEAGEAFGNPDADPFDLLCNIAWNAPVITRKERASRLRKNAPSFFGEYGEQARQILDALLTKYAAHGPAEFSIPEALKVPPLSDLGNVTEITQRFGGAYQFRAAVAKLQELLYAA